ncbi:flagellin [Egicoccus sp. AB-alg6-2]|uniref:flagellin N-terminal helical domain-containing protein n=1 Tax=Egicoccus sp. AB-alg6-2 TaxID=3242692 RepID=UPI00359D0DE8
MRINQNIAAFNAYRNLSQTQGTQAKSLEKLSSGFRINRAADDASGLVNSENLRAQIGGLKVATRNAQDAISLVQTAEGAQTEVHSMLQRMRDLVVQSGNLGTNDPAALKANQSEIDQLKEELTRIADQTQFGTKKILDGTFAKADAVAAADAVNFTGTDGITATAADATTEGAFAIDFSDQDLLAALADGAGRQVTLTFEVDGNELTAEFEIAVDSNGDIDADATAGNLRTALADVSGATVGGSGTTVSLTSDDVDIAVDFTSITADAVQAQAANAGAVFQVGANSGQTVSVGINSVKASDLGAGATYVNAAGQTVNSGFASVDAIDLAELTGDALQTGVADALATLDKAISGVSDNRATLGAFQNRMESTIRNVGVAVENLQAAESRIRDTDMAEEMVSFTRAQILSQAGTAMLAQANQVPQSVLSLLR